MATHGDQVRQAGCAEAQAVPARPAGEGARPRILLVDDSALLCEGVKRVLHCTGVEVTTVTNAFKALEMIEERGFDLVITDIMMPHMSGHELIKQLQQIAPKLPCVVITGNTPAHQMRQLAAEPNVVDILAKPWNRELLISRVAAVLNLQLASRRS